ncbi:HD domain-containing protein [Candidatus Synechococcus calcipolaris G9]|uniref:HD domain-containing protein n=1 Tax=Candidatus Synechococcus calcipolaris G9 TaxID=1497997 RepID=A0ABT6F285_9SYNE|nr:HD domain-containing protein [Candidatus Synechococcus calcipolaris]MDG2991968.1 HD domain-containing protein [Candidatus Synechococcus calcipolaris G9]
MLSTRYLDALEYAATLHENQKRKGSGVPYISHLYAVSALVISFGGGEDAAISGLLHDGPEDQGGIDTLNAIRAKFGDGVATLVELCSDSLIDKRKGEVKEAWVPRKSRYINHVATSDASKRDYHLVTACDKLHNLLSIVRDYRAMGTAFWMTFKREKTLWYYREIIVAFDQAHLIPAVLLERLTTTYAELTELVRLTEGFVLPKDYVPSDPKTQ